MFAMNGNRRQSSRYRRNSDVNITNLMDVMMVLLVVFMVAAPLMTSGIALNLPKVGGKALEGKETSINISVDKEGYYYIGETEVPADKVVDKVKAILSANPELSVTISGDGGAEYGRVIGLMALLKEAGYDFKAGKMINLSTGKPLEIEVLSNTANGAAFTRVMLPFIKNLAKIGIKMTFRNVEVNIFKNRLDNFDFDMAIVSYPMSRMPGNELKEMWSSVSADNKGSMNLAGIKNPVVDALIDNIINAQNKEDYLASIKAFDRVMRHEYYLIPQWYAPFQRVAYRNKFARPTTDLKVGLQLMTWWLNEEK